MAPSRLDRFSFAAGLLTAFAISLLVLLFVERRVGLRHLWDDAWPFYTASVDVPPQQFHAELKAIGAVPDNLPNFTDTPEHQSFLVQPDAELGYVLRPNVGVSAFLLRSHRDFNLDPPVLYLPAGAAMSKELTAYLQEATRVHYAFSTDADGLRTTVPNVSSARRVLVIGDSVAFGLGVNDESTMASQLQRGVGEAVQIVNAGVAGYDAEQIYRVAARRTASQTFDALIYVANLNDFEADSADEVLRLATDLLTRLAGLKARFGNHVIVMLHGDLEYASRGIFDAGIHGWTGPWIRHAGFMRVRLPAVARGLGLTFVDENQLIDESVQARGTIFAPFALYFDHAHLSSDGNRVAADALARSLASLGLVAR